MATWHQQKAGRPLYHLTQWALVSDPPNVTTTIELFETEAAARRKLDMLQALGRGEHHYFLKPASVYWKTVRRVVLTFQDGSQHIERAVGLQPLHGALNRESSQQRRDKRAPRTVIKAELLEAEP